MAKATSRAKTAEEEREDQPICVDLDGTLILTDMLWESLLRLRPRGLLHFFLALPRGKAAVKNALAVSATVDPEDLPYREDLVAFLKEKHKEGRRITLATATHRTVAERIAGYLGVFTDVLATEGDVNLSGGVKRQRLVEAFGEGGFDYIGDHAKDLPVFSSARVSFLADPSPSLERKVRAISTIGRVFRRRRSTVKSVLTGIRVHQWTKNILLGVPLVTSHGFLRPEALLNLGGAFLCFCLQASATYVVNDLHDLAADRRHPQKRFRPFASGDLSIPAGLLLALVLSAASICLCVSFLPVSFLILLAAYTVLTLLYSFDFKKRLIVDALTLAALYTLRIVAGAAAISVPVSEWLLMFSLFLFLSLALLKRYIELEGVADKTLPGRGYASSDMDIILSIGPTSGLLSVLVLALYISSPNVQALYKTPQALWLLCPALIYWVTRIWFLAKRGMVHHDPIVFAMMDVRSYLVALYFAVVLILAMLDLRRMLGVS